MLLCIEEEEEGGTKNSNRRWSMELEKILKASSCQKRRNANISSPSNVKIGLVHSLQVERSELKTVQRMKPRSRIDVTARRYSVVVFSTSSFFITSRNRKNYNIFICNFYMFF